MKKRQRTKLERARRHADPSSKPQQLRPPRRQWDGPIPMAGIPSNDTEVVFIAHQLILDRKLPSPAWMTYAFLAAHWQGWANGLRPMRHSEIRERMARTSEGQFERALDRLFAEDLVAQAVDEAGERVYLPSPERPDLIVTDEIKAEQRRVR